MSNLLPDNFPRRRDVESAVREALEHLPGGPWDITLREGLGRDGAVSVAVEVRKDTAAVAFASIDPYDSPSAITDRLKLFKLS